MFCVTLRSWTSILAKVARSELPLRHPTGLARRLHAQVPEILLTTQNEVLLEFHVLTPFPP
jgi:hypothetical protein